MMHQSPTTAESTSRPSLFGLDPANPYPMLAQLRALGAVVPVPIPAAYRQGAVWMITRFDEAVQVLKDPRFTVDASALDAPAGAVGQPHTSASSDVGIFGGRSMIDVDGVDHTRLRGLVSKAFTPRYIETLRPGIQRIADALLDRVQARGTMDLVHEYGYPLPITVICDMLGVPHDRRDRLLDGSAYITDLVAEKRRHPGDDLLSQLARMEAAGDHLDEHELRAMVGLLIFAGHETTANLISIGVLTLFDHPDALARPDTRGDRGTAARQRAGAHAGAPLRARGPGVGRPADPPRRSHAGLARLGQSRRGRVHGPGVVRHRAQLEPAHRVRPGHALLPGRAVGAPGRGHRVSDFAPPDARSAPQRAARQHPLARQCDSARIDRPPRCFLTNDR